MRSNNTCPLCDDFITADNCKVTIKADKPDTWEKKQGPTHYHSGCFMDIVNSSPVPITRSDLVKGNVTKINVDGETLVLGAKAMKQL